ncbi:MAG: redoxin domain-containing protein [Sphingobacteriaceae bacterium]|nr:redoxin domain-containing protein [Sphingobacteriaceae bacterium]
MKKGDKAPDFCLFNTQKKESKLADFKGKNLVLLFYPFAFSGTCTTEVCAIRDSLADYNGLNAEVLGVSCDSVFTQIRFKDEQKLNFELLSDYNKEMSKAYHTLYDNFIFGTKEVSKRSAFVIDKNGIIQYSEILETAGDQPNYQAIKDCLSKLNA